MKWKNEKLGDYVDILSGFAFDSKFFNTEKNGTPLIRIRDVKRGYAETYYSGEYNRDFLIKKGDVLIGMDGEFNIASWNSEDSLLNQRVCRIDSADKKKLDKNYLLHFLPLQLKLIEDKASFVTVKHLSVKDIKKIEIPLPSLPTQQKIAAILDRADALRQKDKLLLAKYDALAQSVFYTLFGDPVKNEMGWETRTIQQLVSKEKHSLKRGPFGGALKKELFVPSGYLVYEQFHALNNDFSFARYFIDENKFQELKSFGVKPGDIIISCSGVYLGKLAIIPEGAPKGIINQALLKISLDSKIINSNFFVFVFSNENFKRKFYGNIAGTGIPNFPSMDEFKKFRFIYPPLKLQTQFATIISKIEEQKHQAAQQLQKSEELFQSLLQKAFKGELVE